MGIDLSTPQAAIDTLMNAIPQIVEKNIIRTLTYLGEQCVKRVRDRTGENSWFDQTGNLRSSIGYAVIEDGEKIIESAFPVINQGTQGASEGKRIVDLLVPLYTKTYAMIVVAGMKYADYVEAKENKDVLASTELWAKTKIDDYMKRAVSRAKKEIEQLQQKLGLS